jgi:hypothetical protein
MLMDQCFSVCGMFDYVCTLRINLSKLTFNNSRKTPLARNPSFVILKVYMFYALKGMYKIMERVLKDTNFYIDTDLGHLFPVSHLVTCLE